MEAVIKTQILPVEKIKCADYNARIDLPPGHPSYENLSCSMAMFGYVEVLVWNARTETLVSGHQRLKILIAQGVTEVEVSVVDLPLEKEKQLSLILNRVRGDWDEAKLAALLQDLSILPDFDLTLTGFSMPEISEILDTYKMPDAEDGCDIETSLASIEIPVTQCGELVEIGTHRILCGDSSNPEDMKKLMGEFKSHLIDCDFPYNVNYMGGDRPDPNTRPKDSKKWDRIYSDNMPQEDYEKWMRQVFVNICDHSLPGAALYVWQGHRQFPPMYQILLDLGFHVSCVIAWVKESAAISYADYSFQSEQCLYGWRKGAAHYFAGKPGESNVWQIKRDSTKFYEHPTQKPVALRQRSVKNSSKRGDIVLDTFLGSGSILLACESLGRRCFGMEIDPKYCDVAIRRLLKMRGCEKTPTDLWERYMKGASHE